MTELHTFDHVEVVSELEYHQSMAIKHTDEADRHIALGIEEYIAAGEHLIEVQGRMDPDGMTGDFKRWVDHEYRRSHRQAQAYMQVARGKHTILAARRAAPLSLNAALRMLTVPKDQKSQESQDAEETGGDYGLEQDDLEEKRQELEAREQTIGDLEAKAEKLAHQAEAIKAQRDSLDSMAETLQDRIDSLDKQYAAELAHIRVRHGESEKPTFLEISDEDWAAAFAQAKSARVMEVAKRLNEIYGGWPRWMGEYLPGEAAAAIGDMDHRDELTEALRYVIDWLQRVVVEVEANEWGEVK